MTIGGVGAAALLVAAGPVHGDHGRGHRRARRQHASADPGHRGAGDRPDRDRPAPSRSAHAVAGPAPGLGRGRRGEPRRDEHLPVAPGRADDRGSAGPAAGLPRPAYRAPSVGGLPACCGWSCPPSSLRGSWHWWAAPSGSPHPHGSGPARGTAAAAVAGVVLVCVGFLGLAGSSATEPFAPGQSLGPFTASPVLGLSAIAAAAALFWALRRVAPDVSRGPGSAGPGEDQQGAVIGRRRH